jgi:hypothetical protein
LEEHVIEWKAVVDGASVIEGVGGGADVARERDQLGEIDRLSNDGAWRCVVLRCALSDG